MRGLTSLCSIVCYNFGFFSPEPDSRYTVEFENNAYEIYRQTFWTLPLRDDSVMLPPTNAQVLATSESTVRVLWQKRSSNAHEVECTLVELRNGNRVVDRSATVRLHV